MRFKGERTRIVELQKKSVTVDSFNHKVENFPPDGGEVIRIYAQKADMQGKETSIDGSLIAVQDIRFKMRYRAINKSDWRIVDEGKIYDIVNIQVLGRNEGMWLMCKERDNAEAKDMLQLSDGSYLELDEGYLELSYG